MKQNLYEEEHQLFRESVRAYAVHPGLIETDLSRHLVGEDAKLFEKMKNELKTIPQGAATEVYAATAPELEGKGGMYLYDCKISKTKDEEPDNVDAVKTYALDVESAKKLWEVSEKMIKGVNIN